MAVLAECPICHKKQSTRHKVCSCGQDLDKAKRSRKVRFWIQYRLPGGQQRKEYVGTSIEEARDADGKRRSQKREGRIFEMLPGADLTFAELIEWYLDLASVKKNSGYGRIKISLTNFGRVFDTMRLNNLKPTDIEDYQMRREQDGVRPCTIDMEVSTTQTMVSKAFDNDKVDGRALKAFRRTNRLLKRGENARTRMLSVEEYLGLPAVTSINLRAH